MSAGKLNKRIEIQAPVITYAEDNQELVSWSTLTTRWGQITPLTGNEAVKAKALQAEVTHQITMRTGYDILPTYRLKHGTKIYNIFPPISKDDRLIMTAYEVVGES